MPCDLGYKNVSRVTVPAPQPLLFKKRVEAPKVDAELLELIGQQDQTFVDWMNELDNGPLLALALERALAEVGDTDPVSFSTDGGGLSAEAKYVGSAAKAKVEKIADKVGRRWQIEVLATVAQLLDYDTQITETKGGVLKLEGEKHGGTSQVHEYLRVTLDPTKGSTLMFEHFASQQEVDLVRAKFLALGQKLGVKIDVVAVQASGSPIPSGSVHNHFLKDHRK
jgi:hypothetical protein